MLVKRKSIEEVHSRLALGDMGKKLDAVKMLVHSMPVADQGRDIAIVTRAYTYAIADLPEVRVVEAVKDLISGRAGVKWLPMPNEFGMMVRERMADDQSRAWRYRQEQLTQNSRDEDLVISDAEKARRSQILSELSNQLANVVESAKPIPARIEHKAEGEKQDESEKAGDEDQG